VTYVETQNTVGCMATLSRTWTATDACGNETIKTQIITIIDNEPPVLTNTVADVNASCEEHVETFTPEFSDNCSGVTWVFEEEENTEDCTTTLLRSWIASDACGNTTLVTQTITLTDTNAPVLLATPMDMTVSCEEEVVFTELAATDDCGAVDMSFEDLVVGDGTCHSVSTRTWTITDDCGNQVTASQTITLRDELAPIIESPIFEETIGCGDTPEFLTPGFVDNCSAVTLSYFDEEIVDECSIMYERNWVASDACGNTATAIQRVIQTSTTPPMLGVLPADHTVHCGAAIVFGVPEVIDHCGTATMDFTDELITEDCASHHFRHWTISDA